MNVIEAILLTVLLIVLLAAVAGIVWCLWMMACNERTYRQRGRLIVVSKSEADRASFDQVSYAAHMRQLSILRDPAELYGDDLWGRAFPRLISPQEQG